MSCDSHALNAGKQKASTERWRLRSESLTAGGVPFHQNTTESGKGNENLGTGLITGRSPAVTVDIRFVAPPHHYRFLPTVSEETSSFRSLLIKFPMNRRNVNPLFTAWRPSRPRLCCPPPEARGLPPPDPADPVLARDTVTSLDSSSPAPSAPPSDQVT